MTDDRALLQAIRDAATPLPGGSDDDDALLGRIGDARFVLIGEASHGTHEFYRERARLTRRLIEERSFSAVAVEADWPDAQRVNRFVRGQGDDPDALTALEDFQRYPKWMWRNEDVQHFVAWLRDFNDQHAQRTAGFYGMDLYSLHRSMQAVIAYLERNDPEGAERARARYSCFDRFQPQDPQHYGMATTWGVEEPCEDAVVQQLLELQRRAHELARGGPGAADEHFFAEQNARLALNAEGYYRSMFHGRADSWNLRDTHMADTIDALAQHLAGQGREAKVVVWAHNSHLGDARATEPSWKQQQVNVGQLMRERHPHETFIVGQSTHEGEVTASDDWDTPVRRKRVRPGLPGSSEALLHAAGLDRCWLDLHRPELTGLRAERLERFIGVIYAPRTERHSHYYHTRLAEEYDALLYFDRTSALVPLDASSGLEEEDELPEGYPSGL